MHVDDEAYFLDLHKLFKRKDGADALDRFKSYCNVGDPVAHTDPNNSHAQKHRELPYLRLANDIEIGKMLSEKDPRVESKPMEDSDVRDEYQLSDTGRPVPFTPGK